MKKITIERNKHHICNSILLVIIGLISYYYYYSTLVTLYYYYIIISLITIFVMLFNKCKITFTFQTISCFIKAFLVVYFLFFSSLLILKGRNGIEIFRVPLKGYYTRRIDGVLFRFNNSSFDRKLNLNKYPYIDLKEKYDIKLELQQPIKGVYFIHSISLIEKNEDLSNR